VHLRRAVAGISKYHFQQLFTATYGLSPAAHVSRRRVERAQDLLRATNFTITEVCHAVGFSSVGSFSSRFRELVGETPSEFQCRWATPGRRTSLAASCSCGGWPSGAGPHARTTWAAHRTRRACAYASGDACVAEAEEDVRPLWAVPQRSPMSARGPDVAAAGWNDRGLARAFEGLAAYRDQIDKQRASRAAAMATDLIADLARMVADQPDIVVTDAVCERMGALLAEDRRSTIDDRVPPATVVTEPVLWTSDRYGSRFAVTARIMAAGEGPRWYLWDIDVCGHEAFTVHSGHYPSSAAALADWQTAVGHTASAGTVLAPVGDVRLLAALLPVELGFMRPGGENLDQLTEYHRSKRLAEVVEQVMPRPEARPDMGLTAAAAAVEFTEWLRARVPTQPEPPEDMAELVEELAGSWNVNGIDAVYATCSPHRVALCVLHMRNYYLDDFAGQLVALLPDWTRWLAERNATATELADRCLPYAHGRPHPQLGDDDTKVDYLARVIEQVGPMSSGPAERRGSASEERRSPTARPSVARAEPRRPARQRWSRKAPYPTTRRGSPAVSADVASSSCSTMRSRSTA
jgi:AraC-like DNA-binding protein